MTTPVIRASGRSEGSEESAVSFFLSFPIESGITEGRAKRHLMALFPGACGRGCAPVPDFILGRGLSERSEFRSPSTRDWGKGTPWGPRPGANGFGSFCRNKRTSSCGGETPREPFSFCHPRPDRGSSVVVFGLPNPLPLGEGRVRGQRSCQVTLREPNLLRSTLL